MCIKAFVCNNKIWSAKNITEFQENYAIIPAIQYCVGCIVFFFEKDERVTGYSLDYSATLDTICKINFYFGK